MKTTVHIILLTITCVIVSCINLWAIKASTKIIKYRQPDGAIISLKMSGDEFFGYGRTLDGYIVATGKDGYLYYANYDKGSLQLSSIRVNDPFLSVKSGEDKTFRRASDVPVAVRHSLRESAAEAINLQRLGTAGKTENNVVARSVPVLLVQFSDLSFTIDGVESYFNSLLNLKGYSKNGATGCASDYFNANFNGCCTFTFDLSAVITLSKEMAYYGEHTAYLNDANVSGLVVEACKTASENGLDFSKYDVDNDGVVDNVAIIFAGLNEAESGNSATIWPHKGDISDKNIFCNGVKIASYTCTSEYSGNNVEYYPATIGSFCHEYAHSLGLVDLYDVNKEEEGLSAGLYGRLSLMDEGNYLNNGNTPPFFNVIEREILGLLELENLAVDKTYQLPPIQRADTSFRIQTSNSGEYFLLECRNGEDWDKYIGGEGLVLYHIDKSEALSGGLSAKSRWKLNIINSYAPHECAKVIVSDPVNASLTAPEYIYYPGPSNVTSLTASGTPSLVDWQHAGLGISINDIEYADDIISFFVKEDLIYNDTIPCVCNFKSSVYQSKIFVSWESSRVIPQDCDGVWSITLEESGINERIVLPADSLCCLFDDLEPGKRYSGRIHFIEDNYMGEVYSFVIETDKVSSNYPYVKFEQRYNAGDMLVLNVQNLVEKYNSIKYRVNGEILSGALYRIEEKGEYEVEVMITYPDKSVDIISKKIIVH